MKMQRVESLSSGEPSSLLRRLLPQAIIACTVTVSWVYPAYAWRDDFAKAETRHNEQLRQTEKNRQNVLSATDEIAQFCTVRKPPIKSMTGVSLQSGLESICGVSKDEQKAQINRSFDDKAKDIQNELDALKGLAHKNEMIEKQYADDLDKYFELTKAGYTKDEILTAVELVTSGYELKAGPDGFVKELMPTAAEITRSRNTVANPTYRAALTGGETVVGTMCNAGGCIVAPPVFVLLFILAKGLEGEINSDRPFGPNNEIVKFFKWGPNNEIRRFFEFGPNNELRKILTKPLGSRCSFIRNPFGKGC